MRASRLTVTLVVAATLVAGALALASCGGDSEPAGTTTDIYDTPTTTQTLEVHETIVDIKVVDGVPVGGIKRVTVDKDDLVLIYVESDVADEVHLHGYDNVSEVAPGERAVLEFSATIPGRFEVELEERGVQIAELTVQS